MLSLYNGYCFYCKKPTTAGIDHYENSKKRGYHLACQEQAESAPDAEQIKLAERLGYVKHEETRQ